MPAILQRYSSEHMRILWSEESKFLNWLKVELAALVARGEITYEQFLTLPVDVHLNLQRIAELEREFDHDMNAFLQHLREEFERLGQPRLAHILHDRLTSYDIEDPALILLLRYALEDVVESLENLTRALSDQAYQHRWTLKIGRTHGHYAEPTTFGIELNEYRDAIERCGRRLKRDLDEELNVGKMSGTIGAHVSGDPDFEQRALEIFGLQPAVATQILARDRHATVLADLTSAAFTIDRIATSLWMLMRSEVGELEEPKKSEKKRGSSAMPHKTNNPIKVEQLMGLPRLVLGDVTAAFLNIVSIEGRTIDQSSVERHIFARATSLVEYMATSMTWVISNLVVKSDVMLRRLEEDSLGIWAGHRLKNELVAAGVDPNVAYECIQRFSAKAEESNMHIKHWLFSRHISPNDYRTVNNVIGEERILDCFYARSYVETGVKHFFPQEEATESSVKE